MTKNSISKITKSIRKSLSKRSPEILIGLGIVSGILATPILAVKATPKALALIEEAKKRDNVEKLSRKKTIQTTWKCYIPAGITGVTSIVCIIGASSVNARRSAAIAAAYALSESALSDYKEKVIETIGEKKEKEIQQNVIKEKIKQNPICNKEIIVTDSGEILCYDLLSGRYFKSDTDKIKKAENELNRRMMSEMYISLNDFYSEIGLKPIKIGDDLGWNISDGLLDIHFSSQLTEEDKPCLVLDYHIAPKYDYAKNW